MNAKEKAIKSLEGFRLNIVLNLDVDYDVYKTDDIEKAIDIAIKEVIGDIDNLILPEPSDEYSEGIIKSQENIKKFLIERHLSTLPKGKAT